MNYKNDLTKFEKDLLRAINHANSTNFNYNHLMEWSTDKAHVEKNLKENEKMYEALGVYVAILNPVK